MLFFDFLHYFIFKFYSGFKEKGALSTSAGIVGGFQAANAIALTMLFYLIVKEKGNFQTWVVVVWFIFFQVTTYVRYIYRNSHSIDSIENKWLNKTIAYRKRMSVLLYIYGIGSIAALFSLALYHGSGQ